MTDDQALHLVRSPWGHTEAEVREALLYLCDRFEQMKRELYVENEHAQVLLEEVSTLERERDSAQHIASLALDVEEWLMQTVFALTGRPDSTQERLIKVMEDMTNARENRKTGDSS